jgi:hypothetical protein
LLQDGAPFPYITRPFDEANGGSVLRIDKTWELLGQLQSSVVESRHSVCQDSKSISTSVDSFVSFL